MQRRRCGRQRPARNGELRRTPAERWNAPAGVQGILCGAMEFAALPSLFSRQSKVLTNQRHRGCSIVVREWKQRGGGAGQGVRIRGWHESYGTAGALPGTGAEIRV